MFSAYLHTQYYKEQFFAVSSSLSPLSICPPCSHNPISLGLVTISPIHPSLTSIPILLSLNLSFHTSSSVTHPHPSSLFIDGKIDRRQGSNLNRDRLYPPLIQTLVIVPMVLPVLVRHFFSFPFVSHF